MINAAEYPELNLLLWNRKDKLILPVDAFAIYERNWRFIDHERMTEQEKMLIHQLMNEYGHGVLNV